MAKIALISLYDNWALGLRALSNALIDNGHEVFVIHFKLPSSKREETFMKHPLNYENLHSGQCQTEMVITGNNIDINMWTNNELWLLGDLLEDLSLDIIGLSTRSVYEEYINQIIGQIKKVKGPVTVAGGFGVTFEPEFYLKHFDYVCIGEGEEALVKMADAIDNKSELFGINNLCFMKDGKQVLNKLAKPDDTKDYFFSKNMERVPHYFIENNTLRRTDSFLEYIRDLDLVYGGIYFTMCGRGCILNCTFCSAGQFYQLYEKHGTPVKMRRTREINKIIEELKCLKKYRYRKINFMDSFFIGSNEFLLNLFERYRKEVGIPFFAQFYPEQILKSPEILEGAVKAGLVHTVVGIQSGSERISNKIFNRKTSNQNLIAFSKLISKYDNILLDYHLITHNPFEDDFDFNENLGLLAQLPKKNAQLVLQRLRPFPATEIDKMIKKEDFGKVDRAEQNKKFALYLIRFFTEDAEFEKICKDTKAKSLEDLKKIYSEIRRIPRDANSWAESGWQQYALKHYDDAINAFNKALQFNPKNILALKGLGWTYQQKKEYDRAIEQFKETLKYASVFERDTIQETQRGLAWAYYSIKKYTEAIQSFNEAFNNTDTKAKQVLQDIFRGLGWSYFQSGKNDKVAEFFKKALENIEQNDTEALQDALHGMEAAKNINQ